MRRGYRRRKPCALGTEWISHGFNGTQTLLAACSCGTYETCEFCKKRHVFVARCPPCASRRLPGLR